MTSRRAAVALALALAFMAPSPPTNAALDWQRGPMTIDGVTWTVTETKVSYGRDRDGKSVPGSNCSGYWRVVTIEAPGHSAISWASCRNHRIKTVTYENGALVIFDGKKSIFNKP